MILVFLMIDFFFKIRNEERVMSFSKFLIICAGSAVIGGFLNSVVMVTIYSVAMMLAFPFYRSN
ncbi:hypothetical protein KY46_03190 [Photobacterium halotolerans]|uniref:Uncharacterized protein n=1 Tax=Photobacterium halotolerans TaxID=265726 RepID=A0A0F5VH74_9GAMM|nr:hypothetical protein KY46_03190 [Photobacterium halotolerans]